MVKAGWRIHRCRTLALVALGLALLTGTALAADCPSPDSPAFAVGDEWRNEGGNYPVVTRVVAIEGDGSVVESNADATCQEGCRYVRDRNLMSTGGTDRNGKPTYVSGLQGLNFPLQVGKQWDQRRDFRLGSGAMVPFHHRWKVEGCEEVKVKAGTFRAFRIFYDQENLGPGRLGGKFTYWWSPEARAIVKWKAHTTGWGRDWEMVSYGLK
jgi:hypothetical protein